jgi:hypothetical protein
MQTVTIGLDIAKSIFQVHGAVVIRRRLKRRYVLSFLSEATAVPVWHRLFSRAVHGAHSRGFRTR